MEIVKLNKEQLKRFIESEDYKKMEVLPISKHRAISHINNPRALDSDVLLILVYENKEMVGYLGILPDDLDNGEHVGWLSCIWTSPKMRGKGIAKKLVETAYECYNKKILITNYTYEAGMLYNKLGIFTELPEMKGIRYYRKMCLSLIIPERFSYLKSYKNLFKLFDIFFNFFWNIFLFLEKSFFSLKDLKVIRTSYDDIEFINFINNYNYSIFKRSYDEFKWMLCFPWIKETNKFSEERNKYMFSSEEKEFKQEIFKVIFNNNTVAFIIITLKNKHLKFPYIFTERNFNNHNILNSSIKYIILHYNCYYSTIFYNFSLKLKFLRIFSKKISRKFLFSKEIKYNKDHLIIYDGDGDSFFT